MIEKNKQKVYNLLFDNAVKHLLTLLKEDSITIYKLLSIAAHERYKIEYILSKLFPQLNLDHNLDKFGRCRHNIDNYGRPAKYRELKTEHYMPFNFLIDKNHNEVIFTPIYKKYKHYDEFIKNKCIYYNAYITNEPIFYLLYKFDPRGYTTIYNDMELTTFYYELNNSLYKELETIPIEQRLMSKDINLYRAIYHTNSKYHHCILQEIDTEFKKVIDPDSLEIDKSKNIIKIFWLLSHATLYERGSCAISEMVCNVLFMYIQDNNQIFIADLNINLDIEAMLLANPFDFLKTFNKKIKYRFISENNYKSINMDNYNDIVVNNNLYTENLKINNIDELFISARSNIDLIMQEFNN